MEPVRFTIQLDYEAYRAFWFFSQCRNKRYRKAEKRMLWPIISIALIDVFLFLLSRQPEMEDMGRMAFLVAGVWLMVAVVEALRLYVLPRRTFNAYGESLIAPTEWELSESEMRCEVHTDTLDNSVRFDYSNIHTVYETHDALYIFTAKNVARVIPKKQLTEQQCSDVAAILQNGVGEDKYRLLYKK
ncbi:MAG: YcxB family protein [Ruminococcaceae bacterium]|nr:YcxB family protein [Oscillospiraceae bacterium]